MNTNEAKITAEMTDAIQRDVIKSASAFGQRTEMPQAAPVASITQAREQHVQAGEYAGKTRSEAIAAQTEKNRSSVKAQRNNAIEIAKKKLVEIDHVIERHESANQVRVDEVTNFYKNLTSETRELISETQKTLSLLHKRLEEENKRLENEINDIANDYIDKRIDLEAMKAAESSFLSVLMGKQEKPKTEEEDFVEFMRASGLTPPVDRFGKHPLDRTVNLVQNDDGSFVGPNGVLYRPVDPRGVPSES
jgi:hypothetical protein